MSRIWLVNSEKQVVERQVSLTEIWAPGEGNSSGHPQVVLQFTDGRTIRISTDVTDREGWVELGRKLVKLLGAEGRTPAIAAAHPDFDCSNHSTIIGRNSRNNSGPIIESLESESGTIRLRTFHAMDPLFPGVLPSLQESSKREVVDRFNTGELDLAALPDTGRWGRETAPVLADRVEGMLLGVAVGDALGGPLEGMTGTTRRTLVGGDITSFVRVIDGGRVGGYGGGESDDGGDGHVYEQHAGRPGLRVVQGVEGAPTDDTQFTFWTMESMLDRGYLDLHHLIESWHRFPIIGLGKTVMSFFNALAYHPGDFWGARRYSAGNGALTRVAGVYAPHSWTGGSQYVWDVIRASALTHDHRSSTAACVAFAEIYRWLLRSERGTPIHPKEIIERYVELARPLEGDRVLYSRDGVGCQWSGPLWRFVEDHVPRALEQGSSVAEVDLCWHSGAYLLETVPMVLFIVCRYLEDPQEALIRAATDTWDNDTIGACVGALLGARHGTAPWRDWLPRLTGRTNLVDNGKVNELIMRLRQLGARAQLEPKA